MATILSPHWVPLHRKAEDKAIFEQWQPPFVKLVWDGAQVPYLEDIPSCAKIIWRNYPLSEQFHGGLDTGQRTFAAPEAMLPGSDTVELMGGLPQNGSGRDVTAFPQTMRAIRSATLLPTPEEAAQAYLKNAAEIIAYCESKGVSRQRLLFEGPNEYPVWAHGYEGLGRLELARCKGLHTMDVGGVYNNYGVGWPGNSGPDTPPVWDDSAELFNYFGNQDYNGSHEYWGRNGAGENWGWWAGRITQCKYKVPHIVTETGIDLGVYGAATQKQGWLNCWPNESLDQKATYYTRELVWYQDRMLAWGYERGLLIYSYDGNRDDWGMFSIDMEPFLSKFLPTIAALPALPVVPPLIDDPVLPPVGTTLPEKLQAAAEAHDVLPINPRAALSTYGFAHGWWPTSDEFALDYNGTTYIAQRFRVPTSDSVVVVYAPKDQWNKISILTYVPKA